MSKLSIYANSWINLVFEGKNQEYGAFQLRQKSDETTLLAFCLGISFVAMLATIPMLISSFSAHPETEVAEPIFENTIIHLTNFKPNQPKTSVKLALPITKKKKDDVKKEELIHPEIIKPEEANQNIAKHDENVDKNNSSTGEVLGQTNLTNLNTPTGKEKTGINLTTDIPETVNTTLTVDKLPEFPGGINAFYAFVGNNFEKLEIEETMSVIVSFVKIGRAHV